MQRGWRQSNLTDAAAIAATHDTGQLRCNGRTTNCPRSTRSNGDVIDPSSEQSTTAVLDKISGAVLIGARQRQARIQLLAGVVEQLLVDSKRARDTDTAAHEHAARDVARRRAAANEAFVAGSGDALTNVATAVAAIAEARSWQLNLLPTIQQAISSLLLTYEPEFLRFGYRLFLSFATIMIAWHGIQMMFSHDGLGDSMFEFAKLLLFVVVRLLVDRLLRERRCPASASRSAT